MLKHIEIWGLGPHKYISVPLGGLSAVEITGRSEIGKTTLLEGVCFALWGTDARGKPFPVELIHDDCDVVQADVTLSSGTIVSRTMTRERAVTRAIRHGVTEHTFTREADFLEALKALGEDQDLIRLVMVPMLWQVPLASKGGGTLLRDMLVRALGIDLDELLAEVVASLVAKAGFTVHESDKLDRKDVYRRRTAANKRRDEAKGGQDNIERLIAVAKAERLDGPDEAAREAAAAVVRCGREWDDYDIRVSSYVSEETVAEAAKARASWRRAKTKLGDEPTLDEARLTAANGERQSARRDIAESEREFQAAVAAIARVQAEMKHRGEASAGVCPTCGRDGWKQGEEERLRDMLALASDVESHEAARVAAVSRREEAERRNSALCLEINALGEASKQRAAYLEKLGALGREPTVPDVSSAAQPPGEDRPDAEAVSRAMATLDAAQQASGARTQREKDIVRLEDQLSKASEAYAATVAEADRLHALLDALTRAPSIVASRVTSRFGDLGPVELVFGQDGNAVDVLVDGRPWWLSSTGRLIVADVYLRAGIRRSLGRRWIPIWVDRAQDVGGQDLIGAGVEPPFVVLRTTAEDRLDVCRFVVAPGAAA